MPRGVYPRRSIEERIRLNTNPPNERGCTEWFGAKDEDGYAVISFNGVQVRVGRYLLGILDDPWSDQCHTCDNPPCINREHLFAGSKSENMKDMVAKGRYVSKWHK